MVILRPDQWSPKGVASLETAALRAIYENDDNLCVVASAGAGKTEFLAQKADFLLSTGLCRSPRRILAISFKSDAARNLRERVNERCGPALSSRFDSLTFDAFSKGLIDRFGPLLPEPYTPSPDYEIAFPKFRDWRDFLERHGYQHLSHKALEQAVARCTLPVADLDSKNPEWKEILNRFWSECYQDERSTRLTFPMINRLASYVLSHDPRLIAGLRATYPFVFMDEFQDTTFGQYDLLNQLFLDSEARVTAVGDNKQRIMVWAGAMPDAFTTFATDFNAKQETLLSNWRSHPELVEIQHAIAVTLEHGSAKPEAMRAKAVDGEVCAIWAYADKQSECECVADWIADSVNANDMAPQECAILVRNQPEKLEAELKPAFARLGLRFRNVARMPEGARIAIQDILTEEFTLCIMAMIRLSAMQRAPDDWHFITGRLSAIRGLDQDNDVDQSTLQEDLGDKLKWLRSYIAANPPSEASCTELTQSIVEFIGEPDLRATVPAYRRDRDYVRVRNGFLSLLKESAKDQPTWESVVQSIDGVNQVPLLSVHKSKGLEFHTVIFFGLDNRTWWSFEPEDSEEMRAFFVAFTRAMQRAFFTSCSDRGTKISYVDDLLGAVGVMRTDGPEAQAADEN